MFIAAGAGRRHVKCVKDALVGRGRATVFLRPERIVAWPRRTTAPCFTYNRDKHPPGTCAPSHSAGPRHTPPPNVET
jgi:hypothetical protein